MQVVSTALHKILSVICFVSHTTDHTSASGRIERDIILDGVEDIADVD